MKPRLSKLPILKTALFAGSVLIGLTLVPVVAQQVSLTDGQVTIRSDGAVYLISNGQRRWVATVNISDDDLNAYPEAEPIYAGLAPFGSATASRSTGSTSSSSSGSNNSSSSSSSGSSSSSSSSRSGGPTATPTADPNARVDPTDSKTCPADHMVKGGFDGKYYDVNKRTYADVEVKDCFTSGGDARKAGYTEFK
jgi:hypothetical protein